MKCGKSSGTGRGKRFVIFGIVFALIFNITLGPLVGNVSAASYIEGQNARQTQAEAVTATNPLAQPASVASTVVQSSTGQFGGWLTDIWNGMKGFFQAVASFLEGIIGVGLCVVEFVKNSPTSLPIALVACPAIEQVNGLVQLTEYIMAGILPVNTFTNGNGTDILKKVTNGLGSLANILFAIILLVIIAATAFGSGEGFGALSNYGIKKMLPKVLVMAVVINTSFYLCAALADLSNIVGNGVGTLVNTILQSAIDSPTSIMDNMKFKDPSGNVVLDLSNKSLHADDYVRGMNNMGVSKGVGYLSDLANTGTISVVLAIILVATVVAMIINIIVAVMLVAVRNVMLVALVAVSPIACVLGILPNTNKIFQKWFHNFFHLLLVYPAVMCLFQAAKIAAVSYPISSAIDVCILLVILASPVFFIKKVITSTSSVMKSVDGAIGKAVQTTVMVGAAAATGGMAMAAGGGSGLLGAAQGAMKQILPNGLGGTAEAGMNLAAANAQKHGKTSGMGHFLNQNTADMSEHSSAVERSAKTGETYDEAKKNNAAEKAAAGAAPAELIRMASDPTQGNTSEDIAAAIKELASRGIKLDANQLGNMMQKVGGATNPDGTADTSKANIAARALVAQQMSDSNLYSNGDAQRMRDGSGNSAGWEQMDRNRMIAQNVTTMTADKAANLNGDAAGAINTAITDLRGSGNTADVRLSRQADQATQNIDTAILGNDNLKGKVGTSGRFH